MTTTIKLLLIASVIVVAALWLKDHDAQVKARVLYAQRDSARADSIVRLKADGRVLATTMDSLRAARAKIVTRFRTVAESVWADTVRFRDTLYLPASAVTAVENACRPIITTDDRLSSTCEQRIENALAQARLNDSRREDAVEQQPSFLRRHLSITAGYGATATNGTVHVGPSVTVGWKLWP